MKKQLKFRKRVFVLIAFVVILIFIVYSSLIFRTANPQNSSRIWKNVVINSNSIYEIKEGHYNGGCMDDSNIGYVFSSYDNSTADAMDKIGFHDIGHKYSNGNKTQTEYCTSEFGEHAIIKSTYPYLGGYVLKYEVIGEA